MTAEQRLEGTGSSPTDVPIRTDRKRLRANPLRMHLRADEVRLEDPEIAQVHVAVGIQIGINALGA